MKKNITVTVIYPITFRTEVDTDKEIYKLREEIKYGADRVYEISSVSSVIHQCDEMPELVE